MKIKPGAAEVVTAEAVRVTREARGEEGNISIKVAKAADETTPMKPWP